MDLNEFFSPKTDPIHDQMKVKQYLQDFLLVRSSVRTSAPAAWLCILCCWFIHSYLISDTVTSNGILFSRDWNSPCTKNSAAEGLLGQRKGRYLSWHMKGRPGPCESWNEAELWKSCKVPETQELHSNITTLPKHKPIKLNILVLKISSLGCLCMPFLLIHFGRGVEKKAERQSCICKAYHSLADRIEAKKSSII